MRIQVHEKLNSIPFWKSLKGILVFWFLVISFIQVIIVNYASYLKTNTALHTSVLSELNRSSSLHKKFIDNWFSFRKIDISAWSKDKTNVTFLTDLVELLDKKNIPVKEFINTKEYIACIKGSEFDLLTIAEEYTYIYDVFLIDAKGNILYTVAKESDLGTNMLTEQYANTRFASAIKATLNTQKVQFSDLEKYAPSHGDLAEFLTAPIIDNKGKTVGVFAFQIKESSIFALLKAKVKSEFHTYNYLVGEDGFVRSFRNDFSEVLDLKVNNVLFTDWKKSLALGKKSNLEGFEYVNPFGEEVIASYESINILNKNFLLVSEIDKSKASININNFIKNISAFSLFLLLLIFVISSIVTRKITMPLEELSKSVLDFAGGDRTVRIDMSSTSEIGVLANSFKTMIQSIKQGELEVLEQKYALNAHAIVAITDTEGKITLVNDKFIAVSGFSRKELIGKNHRLLNSGMHGKEFWDTMFETIESGKVWSGEISNTSKNFELYWVATTIVPFIANDGKIVSYISISTDITHRKEVEDKLHASVTAAQEGAKAKSEFLASMSHEIRTPLNAILGFVTILKKIIKEEKPLGYLDIIDTSGKSLLTIINDILDFSKMQSGQFTIDTYAVESMEEFSNAVMLFASKTYEKQVVYVTYIDPNLPQTIKVDAVRIVQILSNLLSNAIKFTPMYGEVSVSIHYENSTLIIAVTDSGIGIAEENIEKIFSAFSQADGSTTRKYGGTGLGLSISSTLANLMDGDLRVESEEGVGSTFTLSMPIEVLKEEPLCSIDYTSFAKLRFAILNTNTECVSNIKLIKKYLQDFKVDSILELSTYQEDGYDVLFFIPDEEYNLAIIKAGIPAVAILRANTIKLAEIKHIVPLYVPFIPRTIIEALNETGIKNIKAVTIQQDVLLDEEIQFSGKVLVAEDNKTNQMLIKLILMDYGIDFDIANDGVEAVAMFKECDYDMVLMDENMPNKNGIEAMLEIKEYEITKALILTPIIALTANALESDKVRFLEAGMDGFVSKPIDTKELEAEFSKYLTIT
ncbi:response regulator [Sulfurimonas sp. SAG-AH-194-I05]|nr:ATP-binding protein [Sulfurimonas sp. SAG-AH-194-I05]MDF1874957.1 response regulator [Sulfurimonas sp. SAG-AH-194-I05]